MSATRLILPVLWGLAGAGSGCGGFAPIGADLATGSRDGGVDAADLSQGDLAKPVVVGDGGVGAVCIFNRHCVPEARCECELATGCFCRLGARGSGENGLNKCLSGNDCLTSLCVEGNEGFFMCSGECTGPADCQAGLPNCTDVALIGRICTR